jgi:response regulator RpfG family c-di-GMP phosphodiesterase
LKVKNRKKLFDLLIVDINLLNQNGFEFIQKLKSQLECKKNIPVMILSGDATPVSIKEAVGVGAVEYFIKPFKAAELSYKYITEPLNFLNYVKIKLTLRNKKWQINEENYKKQNDLLNNI